MAWSHPLLPARTVNFALAGKPLVSARMYDAVRFGWPVTPMVVAGCGVLVRKCAFENAVCVTRAGIAARSLATLTTLYESWLKTPRVPFQRGSLMIFMPSL